MRLRRGYTLIELMIVITLIAIVTATAMPHIDYQASRQDAAARAVRGALQQAQAYAVSSQHEVWVVVDAARNRVIAVQDPSDSNQYATTDHYWSIPMQDGAKLGLGSVAPLPGDASPTAGVAITTTTTITPGALSAVTTGFVFRADGAVSSNAQIYITSNRGLAQDSRAIDVTQATGRVDLYRYNARTSTWVSGGF
jgi:prepilin-type N-terminal cleavage/methylation domain-containing protein